MKLTKILLEQSDKEVVFKTGNKSYDGNLDWSTAKMPNGAIAETELKKLGAEAIAFTNNPNELPSYFLKVYNKSGILNYVLTFYSDGNVFSQQPPDYKFKYENGITLYTITDEKIGSLIKKGSKVILLLASEFAVKQKTSAEAESELKQKEKGEDTWSFSDIGHTVLGIAGYIPGIGDAIDIIDAAWYFVEKKYIDGFLSLIAVIPVVGSVLKGTIKASMKTFPDVAKAAKLALTNPDSAAEFWKLTKKNDILTPAQLEDIAEFMGDTANWITKNKSGVIGKLRSMSGNTMDPSTVSAALKNLEDFLSRSAESIDTLTKTAKSPSKLRPGIKLAAKVKGETLTNIAKSLVSLGFFKPANLDRMAKVLSQRFTKQIISDPVQLNALIRVMPNARTFKSKLLKIQKAASANMANDPFLKKRFDGLTVDNIDLFKRDFPQVYEKMANEAVDFAQKNNNYFWLKFEDDSLNRIGSLLSNGFFGTEGVSLWKEIAQNFWKKSANLIGNEAENVKEYLYPDTIDGSPDAIIGPAIKQLIKKYLPGAAEPLKTVGKYGAETIVKPVADVSGIAPKKNPYIAPKPLINLD